MTDIRVGQRHGMLPGTHEWPRTPECRCGAEWDRWNDRCTLIEEPADA